MKKNQEKRQKEKRSRGGLLSKSVENIKMNESAWFGCIGKKANQTEGSDSL